jgi:hypothetical protein
MRKSLIVLALAVSLLAACSSKSSSAPPASAASQTSTAPSAAPMSAAPSAMAAQPGNPQTGDAVSQKVHDLAGSGATDCGHVKTQSPDETQKAGECAMQAAKEKHAFYVGYDMPGLSVGYARNSQGKMYSVQAEDSGGKPEARSTPCPGELRVAQSGRVTCMSPGSMGGSGANPHGGMPPATGANPHGGGMMNIPNMGTQGTTTQPSHPPASKTPPKQ